MSQFLNALTANTPVLSRPFMRLLMALGIAIGIAACSESSNDTSPQSTAVEDAAPTMVDAAQETAAMAADAMPADGLAAVLAAQPEDVQARYSYRHPAETLSFFGIEPGMTVIEALPGGGWYSKLLIPYLTESGQLIGADYSLNMFPLFGFYSEEQLKAKETWPEDWTAQAEGWVPEGGASIDAFQWSAMPERVAGQADAVLFIRALHNLARFEADGGFLSDAIAEAYRALRPGGVVGVVQHMAPEEASNDWANGSNGYLKKSFVIERFEAAGFELAGESDINVNPADQPTEGDIVWRLPPMMLGTRDNEEAAAAVRAIGESTRMTLLFRKPA